MTDETPRSALETLLLYFRFLDRFFGLYSDACGGFGLNARQLAQMVPAESRGKGIFIIDTDNPNDPDATYQHSTTIERIIERNKPDGENQTLLAHSIIVFIYSVWDTHIRNAYSNALGISQENVASDVMGDLRHYRNAIIHSNLKLEKPTKKLPFVSVGNTVHLNGKQANQMFSMIFDDLAQMHERLTGEKIPRSFERPLNRSN